MQGLFGSNLDLRSKKFFQVLNQGSMIKQAASRLPAHQQIEVTIRSGLTTSDRSEHANISRAAKPHKAQNFFPQFVAQCFKRDHASIVR